MAAATGLATWCILAGFGRRRLAIAAGVLVWCAYAPAETLLAGLMPPAAWTASSLLMIAALLLSVRRELLWVVAAIARRPQLAGGILGGLLIIRMSVDNALDHLVGGPPVGSLELAAAAASGVTIGAWLMSAPAREGWLARAVHLPEPVFERGLNALDGAALRGHLIHGCLLGSVCMLLDRPTVASVLMVPAGWPPRTLLAGLLAALMLRAVAREEKRDLGERMRALVTRQRQELNAQPISGAVRPIRERYKWYEEV